MQKYVFWKVFRRYHTIEIPDKHKRKLMWQSYFFIFRRLKSNVTCFFKKQHFYKQHLAEIQSERVVFSSIKSSQKKNKHFKWKTCWIKSITPKKFIPYYWKAVLPLYIDTFPPIWTTLTFFTRQSWPSPSMIFQKFQLPNK